ncbi:MAG TPA: hypothetical protein VNV37_09740 [Solirubrobacteraceae bacterium]|jgi:hypothetical protein|nr:hypothetical protein [Solirubrobacteraceae bacterium]
MSDETIARLEREALEGRAFLDVAPSDVQTSDYLAGHVEDGYVTTIHNAGPTVEVWTTLGKKYSYASDAIVRVTRDAKRGC